jgi:acyl-CoA hydrolase
MAGAPQNERSAMLALWMGRQDANIAGTIHGGTVMKLCDEAAGLAAVRYARQPIVTAGVDRMTFLVPIFIGELVTLSARVNAVWRTSMEVGVRVEAENPLTGDRRHTNSAYLTIVAVNEQGRPVALPPLELDAADEQAERREREAQMRRANRLAERERLRELRD